MTLEQAPDTVVELLARNEDSICHLYEVYARRFTECAGAWFVLAAAETVHAAWLRQLATTVQEGSLHINEGRFKREAIQSFGRYIQDELTRAEKQELTLLNALSIALNIEQALLEGRYFEVFEADSAELRDLLQSLAADTKRHIKKVEELMAKYRR